MTIYVVNYYDSIIGVYTTLELAKQYGWAQIKDRFGVECEDNDFIYKYIGDQLWTPLPASS
jgi:hypothetical protein